MVHDFWKGGHKYFTIDLGDGEGRACLCPTTSTRIDISAYGVDGHPRRKIYYVDFLKISPQYRNCGHGSSILKSIINWADISKNVLILDAIPLDGGIDSHRLVRFYLKHGFKFPPNNDDGCSMYYHSRNPIRKRKSLNRGLTHT